MARRSKRVAIRIAWDHSFGAYIGDQGSQSIGIIGLVSQDPTGRQAFQQGRSKRRVATLTRCQDQLERSDPAPMKWSSAMFRKTED